MHRHPTAGNGPEGTGQGVNDSNMGTQFRRRIGDEGGGLKGVCGRKLSEGEMEVGWRCGEEKEP